MEKYYQNKIKKSKEKIDFFTKLLSEEKKELNFCYQQLKEIAIQKKIDEYKKTLEKNANEKE